MENSIQHQQRKPNLNTWTCPYCQVEMNSRGASGHLKNKHGKIWKRDYLDHPELMIEEEIMSMTTPTKLVRDFFRGLDLKNNDVDKRIISCYDRIAFEIRRAVLYNDTRALNKFESILRQASRTMMIINKSKDGNKDGISS